MEGLLKNVTVKTPYGVGQIKDCRLCDNIVIVQLQFGTAYLHGDCVVRTIDPDVDFREKSGRRSNSSWRNSNGEDDDDDDDDDDGQQPASGNGGAKSCVTRSATAHSRALKQPQSSLCNVITKPLQSVPYVPPHSSSSSSSSSTTQLTPPTIMDSAAKSDKQQERVAAKKAGLCEASACKSTLPPTGDAAEGVAELYTRGSATSILTSTSDTLQNDRVKAYLARCQSTHNAPVTYAYAQHPREAWTVVSSSPFSRFFSKGASAFWMVNHNAATLSVAWMVLLVALVSMATSVFLGYKLGCTTVVLENSHLQLGQLKFDEALNHFDRSILDIDGKYAPDLDKLLAARSKEAIELFNRSVKSLEYSAEGTKMMKYLSTELQAALLLQQLKLSEENGKRGSQIAASDWEYDDKQVHTALDECRCRAMVKHRWARQKLTQADGTVRYSDWNDHGEHGVCAWKE